MSVQPKRAREVGRVVGERLRERPVSRRLRRVGLRERPASPGVRRPRDGAVEGSAGERLRRRGAHAALVVIRRSG
jgi:hypothetical protein